MNRSILSWIVLAVMILTTACAEQDQPKPNGEMEVYVKRVIDGDTFELPSGDRVRMIGIDTPETVKPNTPVQPYGKEASDYTKQLLSDQQVTLKFDVELKDKYDRLLAYVYLPDGTFVNEKLVREGYARIMTIPPNVAHADLFLEAEREARKENSGLWGLADTPAEQQASKKNEATPKANAPKSQSEAPAGKLIKGNINAKGEKIYHVPGSANYEQTKPEEWFATEEEAQAAGYRAPKR